MTLFQHWSLALSFWALLYAYLLAGIAAAGLRR
jgi:hypothetical protein